MQEVTSYLAHSMVALFSDKSKYIYIYIHMYVYIYNSAISGHETVLFMDVDAVLGCRPTLLTT